MNKRQQKEWLCLFLAFAIPGGSVFLIYKLLSNWVGSTTVREPFKKGVK